MLKAFRILSDSSATLVLSALIIAVFFISPDISLGGDWQPIRCSTTGRNIW